MFSLILVSQLSTLAATTTSPYPNQLFSCRSTAGEHLRLEMVSPGRMRVNGVGLKNVSAFVVGATSLSDSYHIELSTGHSLYLTQGESAHYSLTSSAYYSECAARKPSFDKKSLDALVQKFPIGATWFDMAYCGKDKNELYLTYRKGIEPDTLIFAAESTSASDLDRYSFVASGIDVQSPTGETKLTMLGEGSYSFSAAGRHSRNVSSFDLDISNDGSSEKNVVRFKTDEGEKAFTDCQIRNTKYALEMLGNSSSKAIATQMQ